MVYCFLHDPNSSIQDWKEHIRTQKRIMIKESSLHLIRLRITWYLLYLRQNDWVESATSDSGVKLFAVVAATQYSIYRILWLPRYLGNITTISDNCHRVISNDRQENRIGYWQNSHNIPFLSQADRHSIWYLQYSNLRLQWHISDGFQLLQNLN